MLSAIKLTLIFALIITLLRRKVSLGPVMMWATLLMAVLFRIEPLRFLSVTVKSLTSKATLTLAAALVLIMFLEAIMRRTGLLDRMLTALQRLFASPFVVMGSVPAFLGLLPSPGGARFSAPMVEESGRHTSYTAEEKAFMNYWFRHIWEYTLPLYPSLLLAAEISGLPLSTVMLIQSPFTILTVLLGVLVMVRKEKAAAVKTAGAIEAASASEVAVNPTMSHSKAVYEVAASLWPIVLVLVLSLGLDINISVSFILAIIGLILVERLPLKEAYEAIRTSFSFKMIALVIGVMFFKDVLMASGAVQDLPPFFNGLGIPTTLIIGLLPLIVGFLTGVAQAYVGVAFPILIGLTSDPWLLVMGFVTGFVGVMWSPVHLCLIITIEYFQADWDRTYRMLLAPGAVLIAAAWLLALLN